MPASLDVSLRQFQREKEEHQAAAMAANMGMTTTQLDDFPFNLDVLELVPIETVTKRRYAAYVRSSTKVHMAVERPDDEEIHKELIALANDWHKDLELTVVSATSMNVLIDAYQKLRNERVEEEAQFSRNRTEEQKKDYFHNIRTLDDLREQAGKASTTELLDVILAAAFNAQASDIHLEPSEKVLEIRFRIDGVLQKVLELPMAQHHGLVSRIKVQSKMKLDDKSNTQDGRFGLQDKGINADLRVATIPTGYGEGIVMRILRQDMQTLTIQELGFSEYNQGLINRIIKKPYGLIIVTGPTGSGKSTTLYALLKVLNSPEKKIITLEDPIEYRLPGLQQSQIDSEHGFTFAEGLRGAMRQDPDIVMIGEIRDPETATIALNASLTGHLVLSTLHTNNAVTAHTRFLEMGIEPFLLAGSIQMVVAQRLVRKLVPGTTAEKPEYSGRIVIGEVLCPNTEFEQAVMQHRDQGGLEQIAERGGMVSMLNDGLDKVKRGMTTESEIYRVTSA
ncbi:MAG: GspE/PulE family protein [bacterium]